MADEHDPSEPTTAATDLPEPDATPPQHDETGAVGSAVDDSEGTDAAPNSEAANAEGPEGFGADPVARGVVERLNQAILGELVLHYSERDVTVVVDGNSASKVMAVFTGTGSRLALQDPIQPGEANMGNLWTAFDLERLLAVTWIPGLPKPGGRTMTVDPPAPTRQ